MLIVYATQSNTSKKFAEKLQEEASLLSIKSQLKNISELSIADFNQNIYIVFFLSTYGEGGPSDDCIEFHDYLTKKFLKEIENRNLCYSIFGLGSSKYENFNEIAKKFDKVFQKAKLQLIYSIGEGDDSKNIRDDFVKWKEEYWNTVFDYFKINNEKFSKIRQEMNVDKLFESNVNDFEIILSDLPMKDLNIKLDNYDYNTKRFIMAEFSKIEEIKELRKEKINGSTLKVTYDLNDTNIKYDVADNIGVYPINSEDSVNFVIKHMNYNADQFVTIRLLKPEINKKIPIPNNISVFESLITLIDLSAQIT